MILDSMMATDDVKRKQGEKILENYKKQLADRMTREKVNQQAKSTTSMSKMG